MKSHMGFGTLYCHLAGVIASATTNSDDMITKIIVGMIIIIMF